MFSKLSRERLTYAAMSVFLAWHTAAMVIAPAPDYSAMAIALRPIFEPYLKLLRLDNPWDFFAPTVDYGSELRYTVDDAAGARHTFTPTDSLSWYHPDYFWSRSWYYGIMDEPEIYAEGAAASLCRKHAQLRPAAITFIEYQRVFFGADDYLEGKRPTDPEFGTPKFLKRVPCPGS